MSDGISAGSRVGDYRVTGLVGRGGMGVVYLAEHAATGDQVALKVLMPDLAASEELRRRFLREARYASELDHPHIVAVREAGEVDGILYIAMQYVQGKDLQAVLTTEGALGPAAAVWMLEQVASALDAAHASGLLHRDVKPGNVVIASGQGSDPPGHCYLTDFGLSKNPSKDSAALTAVGDFVGTLLYTAPEQVLTDDVDYRVDIYSVGCILYEILSGEPPFLCEQDADLLQAHVSEPPPKLTALQPDLPSAVDDVIARAMAKEPADRYASCMQLVEAARTALGPLPVAVDAAPDRIGETNARSGPGDRWERLPLDVATGPAAGGRIGVEEELLIGRHAAGGGALGGDAQISARHARVWRGPEGTYLVEDLGSRNGTLVNGEPVAGPCALCVGDRIVLGATTLVAASNTEPAAATEPPSAAVAVSSLLISLSVDAEAGAASLSLGESSEPIKLVHAEGRWRLASKPA